MGHGERDEASRAADGLDVIAAGRQRAQRHRFDRPCSDQRRAAQGPSGQVRHGDQPERSQGDPGPSEVPADDVAARQGAGGQRGDGENRHDSGARAVRRAGRDLHERPGERQSDVAANAELEKQAVASAG
jgi:hypothetical protein